MVYVRLEKLKSKHEGIKMNKPRAAQSGWLTKKYFRWGETNPVEIFSNYFYLSYIMQN